MADEATEPDFCLVLSEGYCNDTIPRKCWGVRPVRTEEREDLLLIRIEPHVLHDKLPRDKLVIAARHAGCSVLSISSWPVYANAAVALSDDVETTGFVRTQDLYVLAWAELYPTEKDALDSLRPPDPSAYPTMDYSQDEPGMPKVTFLCEQDGDAERQLKARLAPILTELATLERAYLAMVSYDVSQSTLLTLCLQLHAGPQQKLLEAIDRIMVDSRSADRPLAILVLTGKQEHELAKVCRPFFVATPLAEPGKE